jgi:hypothetical protein
VVGRTKRNQQRNWICEVSQSIANRCDLRYDDAGNVIETHEHADEFKGGAFTFVPENGRQK